MATRARWIVAIVSGFIVGCSGSSSPGIPVPYQTSEIAPAPSGQPTTPPTVPHSHEPDAAPAPDAGSEADAGPSTDGGAFDAGPPVSACEECSVTSCAAQRLACEDDATCPQLKQCLDECGTSECRSQCFVQYPDPDAKSKNGALYKCECITTCASACKAECT